jgi:hypothetical protein
MPARPRSSAHPHSLRPAAPEGRRAGHDLSVVRPRGRGVATPGAGIAPVLSTGAAIMGGHLRFRLRCAVMCAYRPSAAASPQRECGRLSFGSPLRHAQRAARRGLGAGGGWGNDISVRVSLSRARRRPRYDARSRLCVSRSCWPSTDTPAPPQVKAGERSRDTCTATGAQCTSVAMFLRRHWPHDPSHAASTVSRSISKPW